MKLRNILLPATAVALVLGALPALSQTPMEDPLDVRDARRLDRMEKVVRELRAIVFQARDTGRPVVVQPAETDFQMQELSRRVADLEQTLTRVNGELERATFELDQAKRDAQSLQAQNKSLTDRLTVIEQRAAQSEAPLEEAEASAPAPGPGGGDPTAAFDRARQLMLSGDYDSAEQAWQDYVGRYGDTSKAPEARYWLGKTLSVRGANADAATAYIGSIRGWPQTGWAPDAVVELSRSLVALKKPAEACQTLAELGKRYPKAAAPVKSRAATVRTQAKCSA